MSGARRRSGFLRRSVLVCVLLYATVLALVPLLHHDLACHLKSPTHCQACVASPFASRTDSGAPAPPDALPLIGRVEAGLREAPRPGLAPEVHGRSPPA